MRSDPQPRTGEVLWQLEGFQEVRTLAMASNFNLPFDLAPPWEEDRKFILRGWSLVFCALATAMMLSVADGRMVYLHGSYTGFLGFWTNCQKHKCPDLNQVTVLIHMSKGFMLLALALCLVLLPSMAFSFRPVCRRLNKIDLVFSCLSISIGLLILLSLTLFIANCELLRPKPQISYVMTFYLCWCAIGLMLWSGALSYLNQVGFWSRGTHFAEKPLSYRRRTLQQTFLTRASLQQKSEQIRGLPSQGDLLCPPRSNAPDAQDTGN